MTISVRSLGLFKSPISYLYPMKEKGSSQAVLVLSHRLAIVLSFVPEHLFR